MRYRMQQHPMMAAPGYGPRPPTQPTSEYAYYYNEYGMKRRKRDEELTPEELEKRRVRRERNLHPKVVTLRIRKLVVSGDSIYRRFKHWLITGGFTYISRTSNQWKIHTYTPFKFGSIILPRILESH